MYILSLLINNHNVKLLLSGYEKIPYFTSWINSGFECIGKLKLRDGKRDMNYINEKLVVKVNMLAESNTLQKALHHYVDGLDNVEPSDIKSPLFGNED